MKLLICFSAMLLCAMTLAQAAEINLTEAMQKSLAANKALDSTSDATFTLTNKTGQERVRKTMGATKLQANGEDNMRMTRFVAPADVKGTVSLLIEHSAGEDDMWIYLPALKKVRRLVSGNKRDSFVGTDFSYGDVIGHKVSDWNYKLLREEVADGEACYVIEATPKSDEVRGSSGYGKRVVWLRKDNFFAIKGDMWDESGQPLKTFHLTELQEVDAARHKWQAMRLESKNLQSGHQTVIRFENFKANQKVRDEFFTTRYMEKE
ncbi:MAG: outer membrane lipoprotein-sorting protein [Nitrosomonadales bacterium]|nr:outer membrane lipoprotein-sorting protein [Nitrosomonadales bacterium]